MEQDRSLMPGYPFLAHTELVVENSDVHLIARLYELSREGCRLYIMNPPPVGTSVLLKIFAWPYFFQVHGKLFPSDSDFGVTVAFDHIEPRYVTELNACLLDAERKRRNRTVD
jgi:hypothetical protein